MRRGGRGSHAVRLAAEDAAVIAVDICAPVGPDCHYPPAQPHDLEQTRTLRAETGGRLDIVVANAGICSWNRFWEMSDEQWQTMIDINLTGVWRTLRAATPHMIAAGNGGSIFTVSSVAGIKSLPGQAHYSAAQHGVVGLTKSAALALGEYGIRVNSIHPWGVNTPMLADPTTAAMLDAHPQYLSSFGAMLPALPVAEPEDITDAVMWLAGPASRAVTGTQLTLDMGATKV